MSKIEGEIQKHPEYEQVLQEVLKGQYQIVLFEQVSENADNITNAQALYIQARLLQIDNLRNELQLKYKRMSN